MIRAELVVIKGNQTGLKFVKESNDNKVQRFIVGRDAEGGKADFSLIDPDKTISRNHLLIEIESPNC